MNTFPVPHKDPFDFKITQYPDFPEDPNNTLAIDWETYYDKDYSLTLMSSVAYVMDERFDPYLVAIKGKVQGQDIHFCGRPSTFPWDDLITAHKQNPIRFLAHNASFDEPVTWRYLQTAGHESLEWLTENFLFLCTADMAAYLKYPRALARLSYELRLPVPDKSIRDKMKGVDFTKDEELTTERLNYAMGDAKNCLLAWDRLQEQWPQHERRFSVFSRRRCYRGVPMDTKALDAGIARMSEVKAEVEPQIPWDWKARGNKTPLSPIAMRDQCVKDGVPIPASFAENKAEEWEEEWGDKVWWMQHVRDWRKANTHGSRMNRMKISTQSFDISDFMHFQQMYCGAHTGRSSGSGGMNMQNLPWGEIVGGVNIRHMIKAPPGYVIMVADYSQIEPRLLYLRSGMTHILDMINDGTHVYEAHARLTMGYDDPRPLKEASPYLYKLAKFRVLGLGYGCGAAKFQVLCKQAGFEMDEEEAASAVADYRQSHHPIVDYWYDHDEWLNRSANAQDPTYEFQMLSGRTFAVYDPRYVQEDDPPYRVGVKARKNRGDSRISMWGGTMTENEIQGTGMDILKHAVNELKESELRYWLLDSHDELVFCLPESDYKDMADEILKKMTNVPWLPDNFPLEADADFVDMYQKT